MNTVVPYHGTAVVDFSPKQLDLIKRTVASDTNMDEFNLFMEVSRLTKLNPFRKQIYAVVYNKDKPDRRKMSIITGIDGYRATAARNRDYRPNDEATLFEMDESLKGSGNPAGLVKAVVKCWKLGPDNLWYSVAGEAYWDEFAPIKEEGEDGYDWVDTGETWADSGKPKKKKVPKGNIVRVPDGKWATMPHVMLAKCAEAQALRKGWPEDLSGVYVAEEMDRARIEDMTASEVLEGFEQDKRLMLTNSKNAIFVQWAPDSPLEAVPVGQFADRAVAFAKGCATLPDLVGWEDTNRVALQDFWARSKGDALELKKVLEARKAAIAEANKENA